MPISVRTIGDIRVIDLEGSLTAGVPVDTLRDTVEDLLAKGHHRIVINMRKATFMDSVGLGEMLACKKKAVERGGEVRLVMVPERVHGLLADAMLVRVFATFHDEDAAVASF